MPNQEAIYTTEVFEICLFASINVRVFFALTITKFNISMATQLYI